MNFLIAGTFTDSLAKLTGEEQKQVKMTAFDLQMDPSNPGMQFHRIERAKDKGFWSVRVSLDIRLIVHKTDGTLLMCYVDHHDDAYKWAERRKLETHSKTGAAQLVEIRERVEEIVIPVYVEEEQIAPAKPKIFEKYDREELLGYGVPEEWLEDVLNSDEDTILEIADHLPEEASEAVLELACGGKPVVGVTHDEATPEDPFSHPDAMRRFRVMSNKEELEQALDYPWEKWTVFLHPAQREIVEKEYNGPVRVSGTAGTGKTIVALHRAVYLARKYPDARILLTTFSGTLAQALRVKLLRLIGNQPLLGERIDVEAIDDVGERLYSANIGKVSIINRGELRDLIRQVSVDMVGSQYSLSFLFAEWLEVVDAWQIQGWENYRDFKRLGRKTRLAESKRQALWELFCKVRGELENRNLMTPAQIFSALAGHFAGSGNSPYDFTVVDEAQDIDVPQLRFLASMGNQNPASLFFAGDLGQRIFQVPFSWASVGVNIRGRSRTLRINYRTSHQIRRQADRLLDPEITDGDGNTEKRTDTVSVFNGPDPVVRAFDSEEEEIEAVSKQLEEWIGNGVSPNEIGVFVRSEDELTRGKRAIEAAGLEPNVLTETFLGKPGCISVITMHLAKGLEFRAVVVMACDDEVIPNQGRIDEIGDPADLEDVYNTERHLLYVACTRARDQLLVTSIDPSSEFLDDLVMT